MSAGTSQDALEGLIAELEQAAGALRAGEIERERAAALVERCAELAGRVAAELERRERAAASGEPAPGQERLL
ncbi:MAG: hypothetical protein IRZ21_12535 [Thermoleophilaceae bacterium]|nr:hypothetical protein [Thermoleophilaceae bacterium]